MKMKYLYKTGTLLCIISLFSINVCMAQKNVLKMNPLSLAILTGNVQFEHAVNQKMSLQLGGFYGNFTLRDGGENIRYQGWGLTPEVRFYVTNSVMDAPEGYFVGMYFRYRNFDLGATVFDENGTLVNGDVQIDSYGFGPVTGYQFIFGDVFSLEFFGGFSYNFLTFEGEVDRVGDIRFFNGSGIGIRLGMALGIAF